MGWYERGCEGIFVVVVVGFSCGFVVVDVVVGVEVLILVEGEIVVVEQNITRNSYLPVGQEKGGKLGF